MIWRGRSSAPLKGRIEVAATPKDGLVEVSLSATGVGIAQED